MPISGGHQIRTYTHLLPSPISFPKDLHLPISKVSPWYLCMLHDIFPEVRLVQRYAAHGPG